MRRILLILLALAGLFAAGALAGYGGSMLMAHLTAREPVLMADHRALLGQADAEVLLFSLSTCPYCKQAREWLQANHLPFTELVVDQSADAERIFDQLDEPALPVLVTPDRLVRGFSEPAYVAAAAEFRAAATPTGH